MKKSLRKVIVIVLSLTASLLFILLKNFRIASLSLLISNLSILWFVMERRKNKIDLFTVFYVFYMLYSLSGPISINFFSGINESFSPPFYQESFLLINIVINVIMLTFELAIYDSDAKESYDYNIQKRDVYITLIISLFFEILTMIKMGGFNSLLLGKAQYQSKLSLIGSNYPVFEMFLFSFSLFLLSHTLKKVKYRFIDYLLLVALSFPVLITRIILGSRGPLVQLIITLVMIVSINKNLKISRMKASKYILLIGIFMLLFSYPARNALNHTLVTGDFNAYLKTIISKENIDYSFNLGKNEFGFTFGNFNEYYKKYGEFEVREFTFLEGVQSVFPKWLVGEKKTQIVYRFRDEFFPNRSYYGRISSTGFSAILEGYINFGYLGIFAYYASLTMLFLLMDKQKYKNKYFYLFYFYLIVAAQRVHRISFGDFLGIIVRGIIPLILTYFVLETSKIFTKNNSD